MLSYEYVKSAGMETILKGVQKLATTQDHETCKLILNMIKATCDANLALEDLEIAREKGDIQAMLKAMRDYGFGTGDGV